ncbi:glutamate 5-kinase [Novosphingobium marinum]|uniref:Glutamate 5-kinase n=1 Tax=Novosphingobium marinum TaxID=1514948 RepID=A0A7Y9XY52_9SPHN|nr:glutamate 5-kinase [Novosphingobium marinum]NYH95263.1 glutamate 5-kinase [Novosphingobium marinum]GGC25623.1 glutamate 5-kinase [Novosphingobium marinum]
MQIEKLEDLADPEKCPRIVVKVGSSLLIGAGDIRRRWLGGLVAEIAAMLRRGQQVIVVSSGAIALGASRLKFDKGGRGSLEDAQASAAVGQIALSGMWSELLGMLGTPAAQMLLTLDDLEYRRRYLNVTATLNRLLDAGAIPVINENDCIATHEIRFGDNDRLAARVAQAARASAVLLLSDIDGLYDRDPGDPEAKLLKIVNGVDAEIHAMATGGSGSGMGSGGMTSKLQAAEIADLAGIPLAIINGQHDMPIERAMETGTGTLFRSAEGHSARKAWLGGRMRMRGSLIIDDGAVAALRDGNSLLAKGIVKIEGSFQRGAPVAIRNREHALIARGLVEYDSAECEHILGTHSNDQEAILGYAPRSAVVHRDQLALL